MFKAPAEKVAGRQAEAENELMKLGGGLDEIRKGRLRDEGNINCKGSSTADMYLIEDLNMLHRRIKDEYPLYGKDGSFQRAIEDSSSNPKKYTEYLNRENPNKLASHIHSLLKDENA